MTPAEIRTARAADRRARARDFAEAHGIPEAALVAAFVGPGVVAIDAAPARLIPLAAALGEALALTRNASAVQERQGRYAEYRPEGAAPRVVGPEVELSLSPGHWVHAFAVTEETAKAAKRSIQIFDAAGEAVHKIHLTPESDLPAFDRLVETLRLPVQPEALPLLPAQPEEPAAEGDVGPGDGLRTLWHSPCDAATLRNLLRDRRIGLPGACRLIGAPHARRLAPQAVTDLLERAAADRVALEIRVGNPGCLQIFRGQVVRILPAGYWINVMDPRFNLHLRTDHLAEVWLIDRPSDPDRPLSVVAFDAAGGEIVAIAGACAGWEALARGLTSAPD